MNTKRFKKLFLRIPESDFYEVANKIQINKSKSFIVEGFRSGLEVKNYPKEKMVIAIISNYSLTKKFIKSLVSHYKKEIDSIINDVKFTDLCEGIINYLDYLNSENFIFVTLALIKDMDESKVAMVENYIDTIELDNILLENDKEINSEIETINIVEIETLKNKIKELLKQNKDKKVKLREFEQKCYSMEKQIVNLNKQLEQILIDQSNLKKLNAKLKNENDKLSASKHEDVSPLETSNLQQMALIIEECDDKDILKKFTIINKNNIINNDLKNYDKLFVYEPEIQLSLKRKILKLFSNIKIEFIDDLEKLHNL